MSSISDPGHNDSEINSNNHNVSAKNSALPLCKLNELASFVVPSLAVAASLYSVFSSRAFEGVQASFSKVPSTAPPGPVTVALVMVPFSRLRVTGSLGRAASVEDVMLRAPAGATGEGEVSWVEDAVGVVFSGVLLGVVFPYTRIVKLGNRSGDGAPMAVIQLIER